MWHILWIPVLLTYILTQCIWEICNNLLSLFAFKSSYHSFDPFAWARGPFVQTLLVQLNAWRHIHDLKPKHTTIVKTHDNQIIVLEWIRKTESAHNIIVLLHGIGTDCYKACYFREWYQNSDTISKQTNADIVIMCRRGHHHDYLLTTTHNLPTHADVDDIHCVMTHLTEHMRYMKSIYLVGYSGGGHHALSYATLPNHISQLAGVVSVSASVNLLKLGQHLKASPILDKLLGFTLSELFRQNRHIYKETVKVKSLKATEMEECNAAQLGISLDEYWGQMSVHTRLHLIRVPTLIMMSRDDPVLPVDMHQDILAANNQNITMIVTEYGGHVAWITSSMKSWSFHVIKNFILAKNSKRK